MNKETVLENLCVYDKRNPYFDSENEYEKKDTCFCDNCFYGRHVLAEEILKLNEKHLA